MLLNSCGAALFYILSTWEELTLLNRFSMLRCVLVVFNLPCITQQSCKMSMTNFSIKT